MKKVDDLKRQSCGDGSLPIQPPAAEPSGLVRPRRVLVNMECSGVIRRALRALGHDAWSCDLKPAADGGQHIQGDGYEVAYWGCWDDMIAHPVCTFMANSANKHLYLGMRKENGIDPKRWANMEASAHGFLKLWNAPIERVAIENPIMGRHARAIIGMAPSQIIQPYMFGHPESKATCLWKRGLSDLVETKNVYQEMMTLPERERARVHFMAPGPERQAKRSQTYAGIGDAIAQQWFGLAEQRRAAA